MYAFALRNTTVNHIRGCVVKILYPTLPRFQSKMAIVWDRSMVGQPAKRHNVRAQQQEAVSDWLNPFSLGPCQPPLTLRN